MRKQILSILLIFFSITVFTQDNAINQERLKKYWYLRWRLINYFMVVGEGPGMSLPAAIRNSYADPDTISNEQYWSKSMNFGDAPNYLGYYIGILATEYKLLSDNGQNTNQTLMELYYAIKAINRLDECEAQYPWSKGSNSLDGLCSRGDIDTGFVRDHSAELNKGLKYDYGTNQVLLYDNPLQPGDPSMEVLTGSHYTYPLDVNTNPIPRGNTEIISDKSDGVMSQDHISSILVGLALVKKFIPPGTNYNGLPLNNADYNANIHSEAQHIAKRLIDYMQNNDWFLKNPDGDQVILDWGGSAHAFSYGFGKAAAFIWPQHTADFLGPLVIPKKVVWDGLATAFLGATDFANWAGICEKIKEEELSSSCNNSGNAWIVLNLAAVGNSWETVILESSAILSPVLAPAGIACLVPGLDCTQGLIWAHSKIYEWEAYYPLLHATLHNSGCLTSRSRIEQDLNSMPCSGHWGGDNVPPGWATSIKYHYIPAENTNGGNAGFAGKYSGLEYMLLHNLYYLHGNNKDSEGNTLPQYQNFFDLSVIFDFPIQPLNFGSMSNPVTIGAFNSITAGNTIKAVAGSNNLTGNVTYRSGNSIKLRPGFKVERGAKWKGVIDPFACSGNAYARMANNNAQADSAGTKKGNKGPDNSNDDFLYGMQNMPFKPNKYAPMETVNEEPVVQTSLTEEEKVQDSDQLQISISPNPSQTGVFQLSFPGSLPFITVYNVLGEIVYYSFARSTQHTIDGSAGLTINISDQPKGLYFVKAQNAEKVFVQKLISR